MLILFQYEKGTSREESSLEFSILSGQSGSESTEAIALMQGSVKSMTNTKRMLVTAAVLLSGLVTAGAGVLAYSPPPGESRAFGRPTTRSSPTGRGPSDWTRPASSGGHETGHGSRSPHHPGRSRGSGWAHLSGVDVVATVWYWRGSGALEMVPPRSKSNAQGQTRLEVARERPMRGHQCVRLGVSTRACDRDDDVSLAAKASPIAIPLTLSQPARWTITVLGSDDRPIAGLRLAPHLLRITGGPWTTDSAVPDALLEPLMVTTDAKGMATPTYLPQSTMPLTIHVAGPGVAPHTLPLDASLGKAVLKLGRPGRVVGIVRTASGQPMANVPVEVWVQGSSTFRASAVPITRIMPDAILRLNPQPLKTGPHGAFQTPPILLSGLTYRVSIRQDGFSPFVSDWVALDGERVTIPPIRLRPLRTLTGQIKDRQGRAVAGAGCSCRPVVPRRRPTPKGGSPGAALTPGRP